jgi:hypothetical protein
VSVPAPYPSSYVEPPYGYAPYEEARPDRFTAYVDRMVDRTPRWVGPAAAAGGIAAAIGYTVLIRPTSVFGATHPTCIVRLLTGFDCPGCGGTRAAWYLLHGDLADAARHNAPFVVAVPFLMYMYIAWTLNTLFGWKVPQLRLSTTSLIVFMGAWMAFSVLRNLPWAPFTWLYV